MVKLYKELLKYKEKYFDYENSNSKYGHINFMYFDISDLLTRMK